MCRCQRGVTRSRAIIPYLNAASPGWLSEGSALGSAFVLHRATAPAHRDCHSTDPGWLLTTWCVCVGDDITFCVKWAFFWWSSSNSFSFTAHFNGISSFSSLFSCFPQGFPLLFLSAVLSPAPLPHFFVAPSHFCAIRKHSHLAQRGLQILFMNSEL